MNKTLLSNIELDAPMFINLSQTLVTALICYGKKTLSILYPDRFSFPQKDIWDPQVIRLVRLIKLHYLIMWQMAIKHDVQYFYQTLFVAV